MTAKRCFTGIIALSFFLLQCSSPNPPNEAGLPPPESESKITPAMAEAAPALQRMVAVKFKEGTSEATIQQYMDDFAGLQDSIPQILTYRAGRTFPAEYEGAAEYDVLHYITYESDAALQSYFKHPAYQRFLERYQKHWHQVLELNSEVQ